MRKDDAIKQSGSNPPSNLDQKHVSCSKSIPRCRVEDIPAIGVVRSRRSKTAAAPVAMCYLEPFDEFYDFFSVRYPTVYCINSPCSHRPGQTAVKVGKSSSQQWERSGDEEFSRQKADSFTTRHSIDASRHFGARDLSAVGARLGKFKFQCGDWCSQQPSAFAPTIWKRERRNVTVSGGEGVHQRSHWNQGASPSTATDKG